VVGQRYDRLIAEHAGEEESLVIAPRGGAALEAELDRLGFAEPKVLAARIDGWRQGKVRALRSEAARAAFDAVLMPLLAAFAAGPEPERALLRWEQLLTNLPSAVNLFRLLEARPALLALLARILGLAPPLADALARRADLLDPLIDASAFDLPGDVATLVAQLSRGEADDDYERLLDRVRRRVSELRFKLGVQLIEGTRDPMEIGQALSRVAEASLSVLADAATAEFEKVHGRIAGGELVIMGYGRLGGGVLTHASDLDLVFLFTGDHASESDGARPLGATLYFNRLAQRIVAALSVPTAEGSLYEVDTRLRPSGVQGPIAVSLDAFARYQRESAWTWEHMALTRARVLHGPAEGRAQLEAIVRAILTMERDPARLRGDVLHMRGEMARHKPAGGALDVKLARGGLVDIEFIGHYLQLREHQALLPSMGAAVKALAEAGLVTPAFQAAHAVLGRFLIAARLLTPDCEEPPAAARAVLARACQCGDWDELNEALGESRRAVAACWGQVFGEHLEIE
jgi:glutamate-ammonia-ligase adenylyltransferase